MRSVSKKLFFLSLCMALMLTLIGVQPANASTLTVNTLVDENDASCLDGDCSLRDAIQVASSGDTITFNVNGTITLSGTELAINKNLTIIGPGPALLTLDGNNASRIFYIFNPNIVNISGITITHGQTDPNFGECGGGAIYNDGFLTLDQVNITNNSSPADTIDPIWCSYPRGGAIINWDQGSLTISNSIISNNNGYWAGGGIHFQSNEGTLTMNNVIVSENTALSYGGGISFEQGNAPATLTNVTISNNNATDTGARGAGVYSNGTMTIINSALHDNTTINFGGGIYSLSGTLTINSSTLANNSGPNGGGGIFMSNGTLIITNSTFLGNTTTNEGGGLSKQQGTATITNSTFSGNSATINGGSIASYAGTTTLKNTIVANSTAGAGECLMNSGTLTADSSNLDTDGSCDNAIQNTSVQINLGALQNNGGFTQTMALGTGSVAIDAGDDAICAAAPIDNTSQNGITRPQGSHCDIGAFEKFVITTPTFLDVPLDGFAWAQIESIYAAGITGGCSVSPLNYCPNIPVTRAQMAVFLLRGIHGSGYTPPTATGIVFGDVPTNAFAAAWIEQMVAEGITSGCGNGNYCPGSTVTRAQMAVFLLRAKYGSSYTPPAASGTIFTDVPSDGFAAAWIEQLVAEGVTSGCGNGNYCPNNAVTRAQMAVFLQRTFNLLLP